MKIKKLDPDVVKRIAAGEVIEEPASVLRELIENAIDAGSTELKIRIVNGGQSLIAVTDNGHGMEKDEIPIAVQRHTTSKIERPEDLEAISTLGFRGEALYAIASVSKLLISSRTADSDVGWEGRFEGGRLLELKPVAHPTGTTVEVADLFFNLPVRRKFMGTPFRSTRRSLEKVTEYALAHPELDFTVYSDDTQVLQVKRTDDLKERIVDIYGQDFLDDMVYFEQEFKGLRIRGFVSKPDRLKSSGMLQMVFVNGRRVRENEIRAAVYRAYEAARYPYFLIFIDIEPELVDFNIHPQKLEVKFHRKVRIFEKVFTSVRSAIEKAREKPLLRMKSDGTGWKLQTPTLRREKQEQLDSRQLQLGERESQKQQKPLSKPTTTQIFQVHNLYIIAEIPSGILIIDQHAAHERIIYERLKKRRNQTLHLMFPLMVTLDPGEAKAFEAYKETLEHFGFKFREMSGRTVVIEGVPDVYPNFNRNDFHELLASLELKRSLPERINEVLATIACKAAIKAGKNMSQEEMLALIDQLFSCETPYFCPHGRPTMLRFTLEELEKRFGRR